MKASDPSLKLVCPVCGAQPQEVCEMNTGDLRFESHRERSIHSALLGARVREYGRS